MQGHLSIESHVQGKDRLPNKLCARREAVTLPITKYTSVGRFIRLNIKNSKRQALKALGDQGLSIVTANPSEFGLKGVNSPLL